MYYKHLTLSQNQSVQFSSVAQSCPTICDPMNPSTPGLPVHHQLPEFTQTHVSDAIQQSHPLSFPSPPAPIPPSIRVFSSESTLRMRWPKYWSFSFSIIPSKEIPGLISFRMDWLDLLAVQGTLKSLFQHYSSKVSILRHSAFFTVQLSHPYMTTGKTIALTRRTFVGKVMSLLFNMLSRLVITCKIDLKIKTITRDKRGHYIMIKGSIQEEDITIVNIYAPNIGAPQYIRQTQTDIKGENNSNTTIVGDFNNPLISMDRSSKQKINKRTQILNDTLDEMDLTDIFRTFHPNAEEYTFFSSAHGTFSRIDHILGHK